MPGLRTILITVSLLVQAYGQLHPGYHFGDGSLNDKDQDEKIKEIMTRTIALEEEFGTLKSSVEEIVQRVDTLYHGVTEWQQWSAYSPCSQTCAAADGSTGTQTRTRECVFTTIAASETEAVCDEGERIETRNCSASKRCSATAAPLNFLHYVGGRGGHTFSDVSVWNGKRIAALKMNCDKHLYSIQIKYGDTWGRMHGRDYSRWKCKDGTDYLYTLDSAEYIKMVQFWSGRFVDAITITTNTRTLPKCGGSGGSKRTVNGTRLLYISGRSGCVIDGIHLHWAIE